MVERTGRPGYLQVADDLRKQIEDGRLAPGDALPSIAQLTAQYEASTSVVKSAISVLRTEGRVIGQQGKGVFVRDGQSKESPAASPGDDPLMDRLAEVLTAVRDLGERVARLEESVFEAPTKARRSGK
jgi:GntR family transcriptional regulator